MDKPEVYAGPFTIIRRSSNAADGSALSWEIGTGKTMVDAHMICEALNALGIPHTTFFYIGPSLIDAINEIYHDE